MALLQCHSFPVCTSHVRSSYPVVQYLPDIFTTYTENHGIFNRDNFVSDERTHTTTSNKKLNSNRLFIHRLSPENFQAQGIVLISYKQRKNGQKFKYKLMAI